MNTRMKLKDRVDAKNVSHYTITLPSIKLPSILLAWPSFKPFKYIITKTYLYNFDPLKPHFYIVKLGFTGVIIIFLFLLKNIDYGYSLEPPR